MTTFLLALTSFFILEILYFKIANHFNIIDKPNQRSSHAQITLRGGGIIFPIALVIAIFFWQAELLYLASGVLAIAIISFLDDVMTLSNKLRIGVHVISALLIIFQVLSNQNTNLEPLFLDPYSLLLLLSALIFIIGIINAYNFMDGINGITVLYSLATVASIWWIQNELGFILFETPVWMMLMASLLVFGFFNLRKKAKTFAGDVGSISMALILCYLILTLIFRTQDLKWILLLGMYGLDAVATIVCRLLRRENIFDAHRSHFYQYLANERKWPHVAVSVLYASAQLILNISLIFSNTWWVCGFVFSFILMIYIAVRLKLEGKQRLFVQYS